MFDSQLDAHFVNLLESKLENAKFARVDSDSIDRLIEKESKEKPALREGLETQLNWALEAILPKENNYTVKVDNLGVTSMPVLITQSEFMRRYKEMSAMGGGMNFMGTMPDHYEITLNYENPLVGKVISELDAATVDNEKFKAVDAKEAESKRALKEIEEATKDKKPEEITTEQKDKRDGYNKEIEGYDKEKREIVEDFAKGDKLLKQLTDLALLSNNMLKGKELHEFIKRSVDLLGR